MTLQDLGTADPTLNAAVTLCLCHKVSSASLEPFECSHVPVYITEHHMIRHCEPMLLPCIFS